MTSRLATVPRVLGEPTPGFYRMKLRRGAVPAACRLHYGPPLDPVTRRPLDRRARWQLLVNGRFTDEILLAPDDYRSQAPRLRNVMDTGIAISRGDYSYALQLHRWAKRNAPGLPEANPTRRVDLRQMNAIF